MITACNEHETTMTTVELWQILDISRRYYVQQARDAAERGDLTAFDATFGCLQDAFLAERHIEAILNNGQPITLATGL